MPPQSNRTTIYERVQELGYEHTVEDLQTIGRNVISEIRERGIKVPRKEWRKVDGNSFKVFT